MRSLRFGFAAVIADPNCSRDRLPDYRYRVKPATRRAAPPTCRQISVLSLIPFPKLVDVKQDAWLEGSWAPPNNVQSTERNSIMVRKLKALAENAGDKQLAKTVRDSAQQIWLAGLGAFAKAQAEGSKVFDALVKEGQTIHSKTRKVAESKVTEMTSTLGKMATKATNQATGSWDKLEQVFEDRVARALNRIGVPTNKDINNLAKRVEELTASVQKLTRAPAKPARKAAKRRAAK
jgi:poly(hydroxyalkanoate) granule-associated protein